MRPPFQGLKIPEPPSCLQSNLTIAELNILSILNHYLNSLILLFRKLSTTKIE